MANENPNPILLNGLPNYYGGIGQAILDLDPEELNEPPAPNPQPLETIPNKIYAKRRAGELEEIDFNDWFKSTNSDLQNSNNSNFFPEHYAVHGTGIIRPINDEDIYEPSTSNSEPLLTLPVTQKTDNQQTNANYKLFRDYFPTYPTISPREYEAQNQIYALKTAWADVQEKIDVLNRINPQDEKEKKDIQAQINDLKAKQNIYADSATVIRNAAGAMGWNMTGMGADDNFDAMTQLMAINRNRGMAELADMQSTTAQKRQVYEQMLDRGVAPHMARAVAESYHDEFREKNIQRLMEGLRVYGTNGDGSLNEFGQMLAGKLYNENPYMYGNVVNSFASPKDIFGANANLKNTQLAQDAATQRQMMSIFSAEELAKMNNQLQRDLTKYREEQANYRQEKQQKHDLTQLFLSQEFEKNQRKRQTPAGQLMDWYDYYKILGEPDDMAMANAKKMFELVTLKNKGENIDQHKQELYNIIGGNMALLEDALERGDKEEAEDLLTKIGILLTDPATKNLGLFTPEERQFLGKKLSTYRKVFNNEMTLEELRKLFDSKGETTPMTSRNMSRNTNNVNNNATTPPNSNETKNNVKITSVNPYTGQITATAVDTNDNNTKKEDKPKSDKDARREALRQDGYTKTTLTRYKDLANPPEVWYKLGTNQIEVLNWDELDPKTQEELKVSLGLY